MLEEKDNGTAPCKQSCEKSLQDHRCDLNQFITTSIFLMIHLFYSTIFIRITEGLSKIRGWDKSPSLSIIFGLSSKTQWLSGLYYADFVSFYSSTQLCGGGTTKSNSNEFPISVPLSSSHTVQLDNLLDLSTPFLLPLVGLGATQ